VKYIGSTKKNIFPFNLQESKKRAQGIVNNTSTWIHKLETSDRQTMNDEIFNFLGTLKESQLILKNLYNIQVNYNFIILF
jgi:hypothetical protein